MIIYKKSGSPSRCSLCNTPFLPTISEVELDIHRKAECLPHLAQEALRLGGILTKITKIK